MFGFKIDMKQDKEDQSTVAPNLSLYLDLSDGSWSKDV